MATYKIIRFYQNPLRPNATVPGLSGLTLEQARAHCKNPETSSRTCTKPELKRRTAQFGPWFEGYTEES